LIALLHFFGKVGVHMTSAREKARTGHAFFNAYLPAVWEMNEAGYIQAQITAAQR